MKRQLSVRRALFLICAVTLMAQGCISAGKKQTGPSAEVSQPTLLTQEADRGRQIHQQILASFYIYSDPAVNAYLAGVLNRVSAHAERQDLSYQATLLYNDKIFATSAPGGGIYLTTGLLHFLENEAQLAGVLAHEIAQLQYRDPSHSEARKTVQQVTQAGAMVSSAFGSIGALAALGFIAMNSAATPHPLSLEKRVIAADSLALQYLVEAGYDPQALIDVTEKFLRADSVLMPYFFDYAKVRPLTEPRLSAQRKHFNRLPVGDSKLTTGYQAYREAMSAVRA